MMRPGFPILAALALASCGSEAGEPTGSATPDFSDQDDALPAVASTSSVEPIATAPTCSAEETTIWACTMENGKSLSICSAGGKTATYRYGGDTAEIELEGGQWARRGYSGGGELQIAFDNDDTRYVAFGRTIRTNFAAEDNNPPGGGDGVVVLKGGEFQTIQVCREDSDQSYYGEASEAALQKLPQSDDLFTDETYRIDEM